MQDSEREGGEGGRERKAEGGGGREREREGEGGRGHLGDKLSPHSQQAFHLPQDQVLYKQPLGITQVLGYAF